MGYRQGRVLLCSSFSKSIAPGLRVGWVAPGRYHDKLMVLNAPSAALMPMQAPMAAATFVLEGHYRPYQADGQLWRDLALYPAGYGNIFPANILYTPERRIFTVNELPEQVDIMVCVARQLYRMEEMRVAAGSIFSASGKYRNCLRINCALPLQRNLSRSTKANWRCRVSGNEIIELVPEAPDLSHE